MCIEYWVLNKSIRLDHYPLPQNKNLLNRLTYAYYLSSIDLKNGYHQVQTAPGDEPKMVFVQNFNFYEFKVLPLGLYNAPSIFQDFINHIFSVIIDWYVLLYLDNTLVYIKTTENHEKHLYEVFSWLYTHKLQLKCAKYKFRRAQVYCFGHIVGSGKLQVDMEKVATVKDWPMPTCIRDVQQFLGFANYYNHFIAYFSAIAIPFNVSLYWVKPSKLHLT